MTKSRDWRGELQEQGPNRQHSRDCIDKCGQKTKPLLSMRHEF